MATERLISASPVHLFSYLHVLVFGSTLFVYNTPRIVKRPSGKHSRSHDFRTWHFLFFFAGMLLTIVGLCHMRFQMIAASTALGVFAFAYFLPLLPHKEKKRLRDFGWLKITVLASVWTIATSVLPILYLQKNSADYPFEILLRFVFIFTLCIIFDIRDMQKDMQNNITTLPNKVGIANSYLLINFTLVLFSMLSIVQYVRFPFPARLAGALLTALITWLVVRYLRRHPSDRAYLCMADGVMLVYAALVLL